MVFICPKLKKMVSENTISALREQINYLINNYPDKKHDFHFIVRIIYNSYANNMSASHCMHIKAFLTNPEIPNLNLLHNLHSECLALMLPQEGDVKQNKNNLPTEN